MIHVFLVDDHRITRQGLISLLSSDPEVKLVGDVGDGRSAVARALETKPDVVIMDIHIPDLNGIDATRRLTAELPGCAVVGLSGETSSNMVREMMRAGAMGFVSKGSAFEELLTAIHTVAKGKTYLSPSIAGSVVLDSINGDDPAGGAFSSLSAREREVLQLIAEGRATKQIAYDLNVSVKTVETHRRNLMEKLRLDNVADLTKYAIRTGLTTV